MKTLATSIKRYRRLVVAAHPAALLLAACSVHYRIQPSGWLYIANVLSAVRGRQPAGKFKATTPIPEMPDQLARGLNTKSTFLLLRPQYTAVCLPGLSLPRGHANPDNVVA